MKALQGGKHVLLEKPATDTAAEAAQIFSLAASKNLVVLEAFHYRLGGSFLYYAMPTEFISRFHPAIQRVKAIIDSNELGAVKNISASLTAPSGTAPEGDIRWDYELGGGSTMDPGCKSLAAINFIH